MRIMRILVLASCRQVKKRRFCAVSVNSKSSWEISGKLYGRFCEPAGNAAGAVAVMLAAPETGEIFAERIHDAGIRLAVRFRIVELALHG